MYFHELYIFIPHKIFKHLISRTIFDFTCFSSSLPVITCGISFGYTIIAYRIRPVCSKEIDVLAVIVCSYIYFLPHRAWQRLWLALSLSHITFCILRCKKTRGCRIAINIIDENDSFRSGNSVHVAADMTEMLLRAIIMDKETRNDDWFKIGNVKLAYCTAIIRLVDLKIFSENYVI